MEVSICESSKKIKNSLRIDQFMSNFLNWVIFLHIFMIYGLKRPPRLDLNPPESSFLYALQFLFHKVFLWEASFRPNYQCDILAQQLFEGPTVFLVWKPLNNPVQKIEHKSVINGSIPDGFSKFFFCWFTNLSLYHMTNFWFARHLCLRLTGRTVDVNFWPS